MLFLSLYFPWPLSLSLNACNWKDRMESIRSSCAEGMEIQLRGLSPKKGSVQLLVRAWGSGLVQVQFTFRVVQGRWFRGFAASGGFRCNLRIVPGRSGVGVSRWGFWMILAYEVLGLVPGGGFGAGSGVGFASIVQFIQARDNFAGYWTILDLNLPPFSRYPTSWTWNDTTCNQAGRELKAVLNDLQWFSMQPLWRQVVACDESLWIPGSGRLTVQQSILGARFNQPSRRAATCGPIHCFRNLWTRNSGRTGAYSPVGDTRSASSGTDEEAKLGCKGRKRVVSCFRSWKLGASVRIFALALVEPSSSSKQGAFFNDLFRWLRVSQGQEFPNNKFPPWPLQTKNSIICNVENANAKQTNGCVFF